MEEPYNLKTDVYSYGLLFHQVLTMEKPFDDIDDEDHDSFVFLQSRPSRHSGRIAQKDQADASQKLGTHHRIPSQHEPNMQIVKRRSRGNHPIRYPAVVIDRRGEIGFGGVAQIGGGGFVVTVDVVRIIVRLLRLIGLQRRHAQEAAEDQQQEEKQQQDHEHVAQYRKQQRQQQQ